MDKPHYAIKLAQLRNSRELTQQQVAEMTGLSRARLNNYEQGVREPDLETIGKLADFFGISVDDLLGRASNSSPVTKQFELEDELTIAASGLQKEFKDLSPHNRKLVADFIKMLANQEKRPAE